MDWSQFLFGVVVGSFVSVLAVGLIGWRVLRPFMKAATKKATSTESLTFPPMWGSEWPAKTRKKGSDGN